MSDTPRTDAEEKKQRDEYQDSREIDWPAFPADFDFARQLERELAEATAENTRLRAALATSKDPCLYCQLPKDEMAKCRSGFPGCARADDLMGCPELGAALEVERLERELTEAKHRIRSLIEERDSARIEADRKWILLEEFEALLGTSDVKTGVERVKQLKHALSFVTPKCDYLHHPKNYQHKITEPCPVEELIRKAKCQ